MPDTDVSASLAELVDDGCLSGSESFALLHFLVSVVPNMDHFQSEVADVGGIWMVMEAKGKQGTLKLLPQSG